jgi:hypothetical protein
MIAALPDAARRALALQDAIVHLGFDLATQIFIAPITIANEPPPPPDSVHIAAILAIDGDPRTPSFAACAGVIERAWWEGTGRDDMLRAWNGLTDDERDLERCRWVTIIDFYRMAQQLIERGIVPPAMSELMPTGRN